MVPVDQVQRCWWGVKHLTGVITGPLINNIKDLKDRERSVQKKVLVTYCGCSRHEGVQ